MIFKELFYCLTGLSFLDSKSVCVLAYSQKKTNIAVRLFITFLSLIDGNEAVMRLSASRPKIK
jgi:hypothetical protein